MSQYVLSPFKQSPVLAVAGTPAYLLGSWNDKCGPTQGYVISDASNGTTTATLIFQIVSGNVPTTSGLLTIVGTANGGGNFNVTNAAIASVAVTEQGVCTVTYTISSTSTPTTQTQDYGQVIIPQPETGETVSGSTYASVPVAAPYNNPVIQEGKSLTATLNLPSGGSLSGIVAVLQGADIDLDAEYKLIHTFASVTGAGTTETFQTGTDTQFITATTAPGTLGSNPGGANLSNYRFYRFKFTSITGSGLAIGKVEF